MIGNGNKIRVGARIYASMGDECDLYPYAGLHASIGSHVKIGPKVQVNHPIQDQFVQYAQGMKIPYKLNPGSMPLHEKHLEYLSQVLPKYH